MSVRDGVEADETVSAVALMPTSSDDVEESELQAATTDVAATSSAVVSFVLLRMCGP